MSLWPEAKMFMGLAGSPSEEAIAVIYSASDGRGAAPPALTGLQRKHLQSLKARRGLRVQMSVCVP